ncbi:MAG TPA: hypothetical protein PLU22_24365, partial [Polyangiaceae bacterium]|nr:hypothetical protein [Polyangiaceae bacterium]
MAIALGLALLPGCDATGSEVDGMVDPAVVSARLASSELDVEGDAPSSTEVVLELAVLPDGSVVSAADAITATVTNTTAGPRQAVLWITVAGLDGRSIRRRVESLALAPRE